MPYEIKQLGIGYAVVKAGTNQVVGRHKTRAEAVAQLRALYANTNARDANVQDATQQYEIRPTDSVYHVVRKPDNVMMGVHSTRALAEEHMRQLAAGTVSTTTTQVDTKKKVIMMQGKGQYDCVRQADGVWEVCDWFSGAVVATLADENAAHSVCDIMLGVGQLTDADFTAAQMAVLGKAGKAFRNGAGEWSYPTPDASYVHKAMQAFGRSAPGDRGRLKAYLKRRAAAVGLSKEEIARIDEYSSS